MDDIYISWEDLKRVYLKNQRFIRWIGLYGALACFLYLIFKPLSYPSTATFKQSSSASEQSFDFRNLIRTFSSGAAQGAATPLMLSRTVVGKTVEELGLQMTAAPQGGKWKCLQDNLLAELGKKPQDLELFEFRKVSYPDERASFFYLRFSSSETFDFLDQSRRPLLKGRLNKAVSYKNLVFTLVKTPASLKLGKPYPLSCLPRQAVIDAVKAKTLVKPLKDDRTILTIAFSDPSRERAALLINTLMSKYEEFLIEQNQKVIGAQLGYLEERQDELSAKLDRDLQDHTVALQKSLSSQGFMGIEEEKSSILEPLQHYRQRVNEIEVELAGLEKRKATEKLLHRFGNHLSGQITEASDILQQLQADQPLPPSTAPSLSKLAHDVEEARRLWQNGASKDLYDIHKQKLTSHLHSWVAHLTSRQKNLHEASAYFDQPGPDFIGLTLPASRDLFQSYSHQLDDLHAQMKQVVFFRDHLQEPHFEISTLSNILTDSVTQQLVQKSTELESRLCDTLNHSPREHERLKETLSTHKRFLEAHLSQTLTLGKIRLQLLQEKLQSLQSVMHLLLQKEKSVLENKIEELKTRLKDLPELWHLDKRLKFRSELTKGMMEGLTQIAESKNLSQHLYQVESKPLDPALISYSPLPPQLLFKSATFGVCAFALATLFFLIRAFLKGLPASLATLRLMGAKTAGMLSHLSAHFDDLSEQDLATLRSLAAFVLEKNSSRLALLSEKDLSFCFNLAHLLAFQHKKIVFIDCNFDRASPTDSSLGLWHYLQEHIETPPFRHEKNYDFLPAGHPTRHGIELLLSHRFQQLLQKLSKEYDYVILLRKAPLSSQDALQLLTLTDAAVIVTYEESPALLQPYLHWSRQKEKECATFAQKPLLHEV